MIYFATYDFNLGLNIRIAVERYALTTIKDEREMSIPELRQYIQSKRGVPNDYHKALIIFHEKFSIPAACLALGILAIPLGIELKTTKRSAGLGMGLLIFILYYVLMTAGRVWGKMGIYHPAIGLWAPNIVFAVGGIVMLVRAANERPTYLVQIVRSMGKMIWRQVFGRLRRFIR
jgi:lipopolysaccharide export system permease protein